MKGRHRLVVLALVAMLAVVGAEQGTAGISGSSGTSAAEAVRILEAKKKKLVRKLRTDAFGVVLANRKNKALYYWTPEKRNRGQILCVGQCARVWPPLIVPKGVAVPKRVKGFKGKFGVIRRPDGRRQLTYKRLPLYTYAHEGPGQVLCNNVDGWFVVRA